MSTLSSCGEADSMSLTSSKLVLKHKDIKNTKRIRLIRQDELIEALKVHPSFFKEYLSQMYLEVNKRDNQDNKTCNLEDE